MQGILRLSNWRLPRHTLSSRQGAQTVIPTERSDEESRDLSHAFEMTVFGSPARTHYFTRTGQTLIKVRRTNHLPFFNQVKNIKKVDLHQK